MGGRQSCKLFIIKVDYFSEFLKWDIYFNFSIFTVINQYFISLHSWMIFLTSGTLFDILRMLSLFLDSRKFFRSYYNQEKNLTISNLKLLFCVILFQLLSKIGIFIIVNSKHNSIFNSFREISFANFLFTFHYVYGNGWENWIDKNIILLCFIKDSPRLVQVFPQNFSFTFLGYKSESWVSAWVRNWYRLHVLPLFDCNISEDSVDYNLNNVSKNVNWNDSDVFIKEECTSFR